MTSIAVVMLSLLDHLYGPKFHADGTPISKWDLRSPYKASWAVAVLISATYKLWWDVVHDWHLGKREFGYLRAQLTYPRGFYYWAIVQVPWA